MAEHIENMTSGSEREEEKIKTPFLHIVVGGAPEKPCYSILWVDSETQEFQFGYSSYCLDYVREWRDKYFEITTEDFPVADVVEVKHGRWIRHEGYDECDLCHTKTIYGYRFCPDCGARMDGERKE